MGLPIVRDTPRNIAVGPDGQWQVDTVEVYPGDIVEVVSNMDVALRFAWDSVEYILPARGKRHMPFEAMVVALGDPRASSNVVARKGRRQEQMFVPDRPTEVRRLKLLYLDPTPGDGFQIGKCVMPLDTFNHRECDGEGHVPDVEVYTLDGKRIVTVLDDPSGKTVNVSTPSVASVEDMRERMKALERQLTEFTAEQTAEGPPVDPEEAPKMRAPERPGGTPDFPKNATKSRLESSGGLPIDE